MWKLFKSELKYYQVAFAAPIFFTILFQATEFFVLYITSDLDIKSVHSKNVETWGGFYSLVIFISIFSIWSTRFKEKRERVLAILPLTAKQIALSRFWFAVIPLTILVFYLLVLHIIINCVWNISLSLPLVQLGVIFILFAGFIRARDDWFSHWNFGKRFQNAFVSVLIIQIIVVVLFVALSESYEGSVSSLGKAFYHYVKIIFYLLGLVIMITTIFSYQKRKNYLS